MVRVYDSVDKVQAGQRAHICPKSSLIDIDGLESLQLRLCPEFKNGFLMSSQRLACILPAGSRRISKSFDQGFDVVEVAGEGQDRAMNCMSL